ncbi:MAG: rhodanese-like domain-containing protein [Rubrivivax sp.]
MTFVVENWLLILIALVSGGMLLWPLVSKAAPGGAVSTGEAVRLINREKGVLVDVGEPHEFAEGHAGGARNIPFGQLEGSKDLPSNKALPVLVMCPSGARAGRAAGLLRKAGYERAAAVSGGTRAWREAQLPIERSGEGAGKEGKAAKGAKASDKAADKGGDKPSGKNEDKSASDRTPA